MSRYTTGELAKICDVTVRTIQFYDSKGILTPSELSEGGRRLYSEEDRRRLDIICFLKGLGLKISTIADILNERNSTEVLLLLLQQQKNRLEDEKQDRKQQLEKIKELEKILARSETDEVSIKEISDIAQTMEHKKDMKKLRITMLSVGAVLDVIEIGTILLWIFKGIWWPFAVGMPIVIIFAFVLVRLYYYSVLYVCPECHEVFRPTMMEFTFAGHTPSTRKLTCKNCGVKSYCAEVYDKSKK